MPPKSSSGSASLARRILHRLNFRYRSVVGGLLFNLFCRKYRTDGCEFEVPKEMIPLAMRTRFLFDVYEKPERLMIRRHLNPDATVLELGACLGIVSCITNRLLRNPKQHVVLEPNPDLAQVLQRNKEHNKCQFKIVGALIGSGGEVPFMVSSVAISSRINGDDGRKITVPSVSVESLEKTHGLTFDTLIMDIEGAEVEFLATHQQLLRQLRLLVIELHPAIVGAQAIERCRQQLGEAGLEHVETYKMTDVWRRRAGDAVVESKS